ncbi:MAG TPA: exo-alpha-sialidase [Segeticoccus sp.]|uniref:WD40/YVTN/BNR-like repeat-containing protein n=1 Tax=Segeticoccus sp. TaxID=2706531 RepID=UPI002D7F62DB|nr:exo-alpha-sialidase [Segeticoccus sp.]HET8601457.1 exo-alpha-sialidase [Segeticoccus sp.]
MTQTVVAIGTRKGLWLARSENRSDWSLEGPHLLMREVPSLAFDTRSGRHRLLVGMTSSHWGPTLVWSDDLGQSWQEPAEGAIRFPEDTGAALARVWQLVPDPHEEQVVWAGTEPHALWRSEDGGETFSLVRGLWDHPHRTEWGEGFGGGAIHTVLPDPGDPAGMVVAMSTGGVYRTTDAGQSWSPANKGITIPHSPEPYAEFGQCVHKVVRDAQTPGRLYAQNHDGVFRTDDGGSSWISVADGLPTDFGFAVLAHPRRGGEVWLVPVTADAARIPPGDQLQLQHSTDGGGTWATQSTGLPHPSYTCVLRDAACVDEADPAGVYVGTRNGEVYGSADEGQSFGLIASQLPDVLCVRAAVLP